MLSEPYAVISQLFAKEHLLELSLDHLRIRGSWRDLEKVISPESHCSSFSVTTQANRTIRTVAPDSGSTTTGESPAQPVGGKGDRTTRGGRVRQGVEHHKVVNDALEPRRRDTHARLPQLVGIRFSFVAQNVGFGGNDQSRGKATQLVSGRAQRRRRNRRALMWVAR